MTSKSNCNRGNCNKVTESTMNNIHQGQKDKKRKKKNNAENRIITKQTNKGTTIRLHQVLLLFFISFLFFCYYCFGFLCETPHTIPFRLHLIHGFSFLNFFFSDPTYFPNFSIFRFKHI